MFAAAVVLLTAVAAVLLLTRPSDNSASGPVVRRTSPALPPVVPATPADRATVPSATPGSPEANAPYQPPAAAERAVRMFLAGYLKYLYGHGAAKSIEGASSRLVARLAAHPPRVSPAQRARRPEIVAIRARRPRPNRVQLVATIDAGETSQYPIGALLVKRHGRWQVAEILNDE